MTHDEALKLAEEYHRIGDQLRKAHACRKCEGRGDWERSHITPCPACWGRGWTINEPRQAQLTGRDK